MKVVQTPCIVWDPRQWTGMRYSHLERFLPVSVGRMTERLKFALCSRTENNYGVLCSDVPEIIPVRSSTDNIA